MNENIISNINPQYSEFCKKNDIPLDTSLTSKMQNYKNLGIFYIIFLNLFI